ncbi:MAG TPA: sulfite exporter TauE/SafE family protein [Miltoncostaeaceae bacterium]|nr:sulfite exporter TauE/SafE family protein [Miltoncostaeaceae bacterium]
MLSAADLVLLAVAAVAGGGVNALAGGGTLITFPALTAVGVPALSANVTNTVALAPGYLGGTLAQRADLAGQRDRAWSVALPALLGGVAGAALLLVTGEDLFRSLVPWLILVAAVLIGADPLVKRWVRRRLAEGEEHRPHPAAAVLAALAGSVYGGYFGAGLGIILLALYSLVLPETLVRVNALKQLTSFLANVAAAGFLVFSGRVEWTAAGVMAVGALAGGVLAGRFVRRVDPDLLRALVVVIGVTVAVVYFVR